MEEAIFITRFASSVSVIHRRDQLRASMIMRDRAFANKKIDFIWDAEVTQIVGADSVQAVRLRNTQNGEEWQHKTDGVFIFIGHIPNTNLFEGQLEIDDHGYLVIDGRMATGVEGVWAAGEVADSVFRQVITSAGMGAGAAILAQRWLDEQEEEILEQEPFALG